MIGGLRVWDPTASTNISGSQVRAGRTWTDPVVGLSYTAAITQEPDFGGILLAGGFGVGSETHREAIARIDWHVSERVTLSGGYRHVYVDYQSVLADMEIELSGPFVALSFHFLSRRRNAVKARSTCLNSNSRIGWRHSQDRTGAAHTIMTIQLDSVLR